MKYCAVRRQSFVVASLATKTKSANYALRSANITYEHLKLLTANAFVCPAAIRKLPF